MYKYAKNGNRVRQLREKKGFTQQALIDELALERECCSPISKSTLSKAESGKALLPTEFLVGLDAAGIATPDFVLFGEERLPVFQLSGILEGMTSGEFDRFLDQLYAKTDTICAEEPTECLEEAISEVSQRLREIRKLRNLSQLEAEKLLGFSRNTVSANERIPNIHSDGKKAILPKSSYLSTFCQKMSISAAYILGAFQSIPDRLCAVQSILEDFPYDTQCQLIREILRLGDFS